MGENLDDLPEVVVVVDDKCGVPMIGHE